VGGYAATPVAKVGWTRVNRDSWCCMSRSKAIQVVHYLTIHEDLKEDTVTHSTLKTDKTCVTEFTSLPWPGRIRSNSRLPDCHAPSLLWCTRSRVSCTRRSIIRPSFSIIRPSFK